MGMRKANKSKLNNAGMTLVEILIAMAILSVASAAILAAFVNSFRYSIKGRELQQTTVLANTIIENCKAYSFEQIKLQMDADDAFMKGVKKANVELVGDTFYIQDVPLDNQLYDVSLKMASRSVNGAANTTYNIMSSSSMNPYFDAVFLPQEATYTNGSETWTAAQLDEMAYLLAREKIVAGIESATAAVLGDANKVTLSTDYVAASFNDSSNPDYSANSDNLKLSRATSITIDDDATLGEYVKVYITYSFDLDGGSYYYEGVDLLGTAHTYSWSVGSNGNIGTFEFLIYNNAGTNDATHPTRIENVYLFYYPAYHSNGSLSSLALYPFVSDTISVQNYLADTARDINLYIYKQKNPVYSDTNISIMEASYKTAVTSGGGNADSVFVYHNFADNLGTTEIGGFMDETGSIINDGTLYDATWFTNYFDVKDSMVIEESKALMYDIEVAIYKADPHASAKDSIAAGSESVLTMNGTALDW